MNLLKAFALAWNMLTIVPFFKVHKFYTGINGYSAMFYPLIGFLLGLALWGIHTLLEPYLPSVHLSVLIFSLWVTATGALHIDGLSDSIDGMFVPKEKALEVMKDAHVGGMGMTFTFVFLTLKISSVIYFELFYLLPIILMLSRFNAVLAIYFYDYISSGVGQLLKAELNKGHIFVTLIFSLAMLYCFNFLHALLISLLVLIAIARLFTSRLGGLNGDSYGFIIEVTELVLLNSIIILNFV